MSRRLRWALAALVLLGLLLGVLLLRPEMSSSFSRLFSREDATWMAMQGRGVWRVAMDPSFPPFQLLDEAGRPVGFDVDLAHALAEQWGLELEIVAMGYDSLLDAVKAGRVDSVVSAIPYDPRATQDYAFSTPYFEAGIRLVVRSGSPITGTAGLAGATLAAEWGSMGDMVGRRLQREDESIQLNPYATPDEAVAALVNDPAIHALLIDNVTLRQAQGSGAAIAAVGPALESNPYVIAMPLRAYTLHRQLEAALQRLQATGTLAELEDRWFGHRP
jgi:polar amino acid transport system substrate-binding protein